MELSSDQEIFRRGVVHVELPTAKTGSSSNATETMLDEVVIVAENATKHAEQPSAIRQINLLTKRLFDIIISSMAIVVFSPIFIVVSLLIKSETPGPVIFSQERWGLGKRKIRIYKFRTMYDDRCDASGVIQTIESDPRITQLGKKLRQKNIDELPQLFNVLRGDMSLVGPRCHVPEMVAAGLQYEDLVPQYHTRHLMRPGITGLAQMNNYRGPTVRQDLAIMRVKKDMQYIAEFSFFTDLKIIIGTLLNEISGGYGN